MPDLSQPSDQIDSLYRLSLKCLIVNSDGKALCVKESGRTYWDIPGGGMEHGESIKTALARELKEEANYDGDFSYTIIATDEPALLKRSGNWQVRLIFAVTPENYDFSVAQDSDEVAFIPLDTLKHSTNKVERLIHEYALKVKHDK